MPLVYVLASRLLAGAGIPALPIKGPVSDAYALRQRHSSVDVDVLIAPSDVDAACRIFRSVGFEFATIHEGTRILPEHSVVLEHGQWPCQIDLHWLFPGIFADSQAAFEALYQRTAEVAIAGVGVKAPDFVASLLITALHYLRDAPKRVEELRHLEERVASLSQADRRDFATLAVSVGATYAVQPLLPSCSLGGDVSKRQRRSWDLRVAYADSPLAPLVAVLAGLDRRPSAFWRMFWPSNRALAATHPELRSARTRLRHRLRRLRRGLSNLIGSARGAAPSMPARRPPLQRNARSRQR
ncbi:nucleotidyltransferase family protein [Nocardioides oceani]|uniref:nucleotidyltransferase family protein n=1 Tax=Nocardioides oceani TaxID=3058369 RepID=UPI0034DDE75C